MVPSRRPSYGRSTLANQQRPITSFFSKSTTPSPSPSPILSKQKPSPSPSLDPNPSSSSSPDTSPTTPSPRNPKPIKSLLLVGASSPCSPCNLTSTSSVPAGKKSYGQEVVGRRIKVYWPLDKEWYDGCVKSFDKFNNKHLVQYDDGDEEMLELAVEKIEWFEENVKKFKRLRRGCSSFKGMVVEEEEKVGNGGELEEENGDGDSDSDNGDDSTDEDWGKNGVVADAEDDGEEMELEDEEEDEADGIKKLKGNGGRRVESRKRKMSGGQKSIPSKKSKSENLSKEGFKQSMVEPKIDSESGKGFSGFDNVTVGDASERFSAREAQKLYFLTKDRRDAKRRRCGEENYDPRTLYLPPDFIRSLSDGQRQWWDFKSKHMDKVLFFKMGKFYELFEMDAHIGVKELDLQYMKGEQPHCGFPERNFSINVEKLARKGYRVLVVEQTETPEQLELRRKEKGSKDKVVKREVCAVVTKGTLTEGELLSANPEASYLMALTESNQSLSAERGEHIFGICAVDVSTSRIIIGQFSDDSECSALCCLLSELRPVEIVKPAKVLSAETERVLLRQMRNPLINELVPVMEFWDSEKTIHEVKSIYERIGYSHVGQDGLGCQPDVLSELVGAGKDGNKALSALGGALFYLKQAFLDETLLRFAKFEVLPSSGFKNMVSKPYMVLDAAALENLEIFENSRNGDSSGTLYAQLNHCITAFGKRLLRTWLARPLYNLECIKERQEAVASLRGVNLPFALEFRKMLSRLPDMERLLAQIFSSSVANGRNATKVVLYEDASKKQLQNFIAALRGCELMSQACSSLAVILDNVESRKLHHLLTPGIGLPDICSILKHFKNAFDWVEAKNSGRIIPCEGVDEDYDTACKKIKEIKSTLANYLKEQRKLLGDTSISFVTVGKDTYLLEVPEHLRSSIPKDYELRSSRKGFFRYWTLDIKKLLGNMSQAESEKESLLRSILYKLLGSFSEHHIKWRQLVSAVAELDVLINLVITSDYYEGPTCIPHFLDAPRINEAPRLSAKGLGHPILKSDSLGKGTFVPNDIAIGGPHHANFVLLTGPNMGGKSTLLRQVCLALVLAQIGADVPAESFELSPVDRIFVRMGAKDNIMVGQSTFLTELSETAAMLGSATQNSLVALDELGRGTSTSDGQAIAESVLEHFVHKVQCHGMFSTHYHRLAVKFQDDPKVSLCHMACKVGTGTDDVEEVTFLYKLTPGACPKSYGVNVARLAGLPNYVLQKAAAKSREFEAAYGKSKNWSSENNSSHQIQIDDMVTIIKELIHAAPKLSCAESSITLCSSSLSKLQQKARLLLQ